MRLSSRWTFVFFMTLTILASVIVVDIAQAQQVQPPGSGVTLPTSQDLSDAAKGLDSLLENIESRARTWGPQLYQYARTLFWILVGIQFIWTFFPLIFRQADFGELMSELVRFVIIIGFFLIMLQYSNAIAARIIQSFQNSGNIALGKAADYGISPTEIFKNAMEVVDHLSAKSVAGNDQTGSSAADRMVPLAALTIMGSFVFMAAFMVLTLVESWIVINASVLFMGLGGSQWTRDYVTAILRYAVAVGAKLFMLTLIVGMVTDEINRWRYHFENNAPTSADVWALAGLGIICSYLSKAIPDLIQGLIMGTSYGTGMGMMRMGGMGGGGMANPAHAAGGDPKSPGASNSGSAYAASMNSGSIGNGIIGSNSPGLNMFNAPDHLLGQMGGHLNNIAGGKPVNITGGGLGHGAAATKNESNAPTTQTKRPEESQKPPGTQGINASGQDDSKNQSSKINPTDNSQTQRTPDASQEDAGRQPDNGISPPGNASTQYSGTAAPPESGSPQMQGPPSPSQSGEGVDHQSTPSRQAPSSGTSGNVLDTATNAPDQPSKKTAHHPQTRQPPATPARTAPTVKPVIRQP